MKREFKPVAIIGYGCIFPPDGTSTQKFWENVLEGTCGISDVSKYNWKESLYYDTDKHVEDKTYCKQGGILENYQFPFEAGLRLGLKEDELKLCNKTQRMTLDTILQAIVKANISLKDLESADFFIGNMLGDADVPNQMLVNRMDEINAYLETSEEYQSLQESVKEITTKAVKEEITNQFGQNNNDNLIPSSLLYRLKEMLGVKGNGFIVDGACSGSGLVIDEAVKNIQYGKNDICITSAVLGNMIVTGNIGFAKIGGLSETSSYPLDERAAGLIPGEGAGTIILKSLDKAIEDHNNIYGVIRGTGVASDGKGQSIYAPSSKGQLKAMKKSIAVSGLTPDDVDYIETHATGTRVGDKVEVDTIKAFMADAKNPNRKLPIGSIKSQIGHAFSAAGMANVMKILEAMGHGVLPPTHNYTRVPDKVDLGNLYINTTMTDWVRRDEKTPRRAMMNAFGFGGINANVLIEEYVEEYHNQLVRDKRYDFYDGDYSIVGIGCLDYKGDSYKEWVKNYERDDFETESIAKVFPKEAQPVYEKQKGYFIKNFKFPFVKYRIPPKILNEIDQSQQYALVASGEAIDDYGKEKIEGEKTGVFVGTMMGLAAALKSDLRVRHVEYKDIVERTLNEKGISREIIKKIGDHLTQRVRSYLTKIEEDTLPGYMDNIIAGRISNFNDFSSTNAVYDKDIVSFDAALNQALISLKSGENNLVIVGGVNGNMLPENFQALQYIEENIKANMQVEVKDMVPAEGAAFFVIKRSEDVTSEDHVYAKITGCKHVSKQPKVDNIVSKHPFYYGAQDAFGLLEKITNIDKKDGSQVVEISNTSMKAEGYTYLVGDKNSSLVVDKEEKQHVKVDEVAKKALTVYFAGENEAMLLENEVSEQEFLATNKDFKMIIRYTTPDELTRKKDLYKKSTLGGK